MDASSSLRRIVDTEGDGAAVSGPTLNPAELAAERTVWLEYDELGRVVQQIEVAHAVTTCHVYHDV